MSAILRLLTLLLGLLPPSSRSFNHGGFVARARPPAQSRPQQQQHQQQPRPPQQQQQQPTRQLRMSLYNRIRSSVLRKFPNGGVDRVVACWDKFVEGTSVERYLDPPTNVVLQKADCYVEGLSATCFHSLERHPWAVQLEARYAEILAELRAYHESHARAAAPSATSSPTLGTLDAAGDWLPPRDSAGDAYGPEWKTLGLQDRSVWDEDRVSEFPATVRILRELDVPSCEVFFAKQAPRSGIKPHSDKNNFIITCHLALDVPEGECWITVGDQKYFWKVCRHTGAVPSTVCAYFASSPIHRRLQNGKSVVFDTSIMHSTENTSDRVRYVLLIRFWQPD